MAIYFYILEPLRETDDAIIMEFKVFSKQKDKTLEKAVENALKQIEDRKYDTELIARGIPQEKIRHYGFAFDGQTVLIGEPVGRFKLYGLIQEGLSDIQNRSTRPFSEAISDLKNRRKQ